MAARNVNNMINNDENNNEMKPPTAPRPTKLPLKRQPKPSALFAKRMKSHIESLGDGQAGVAYTPASTEGENQPATQPERPASAPPAMAVDDPRIPTRKAPLTRTTSTLTIPCSTRTIASGPEDGGEDGDLKPLMTQYDLEHRSIAIEAGKCEDKARVGFIRVLAHDVVPILVMESDQWERLEETMDELVEKMARGCNVCERKRGSDNCCYAMALGGGGSSGDVRVRVMHYKRRGYLDIRRYWSNPADGMQYPSRAGLRLPLESARLLSAYAILVSEDLREYSNQIKASQDRRREIRRRLVARGERLRQMRMDDQTQPPPMTEVGAGTLEELLKAESEEEPTTVDEAVERMINDYMSLPTDYAM